MENAWSDEDVEGDQSSGDDQADDFDNMDDDEDYIEGNVDKSDDADNDDVSVCAPAFSPINDDDDDDVDDDASICAPPYSPISYDPDECDHKHIVSQAGDIFKFPNQCNLYVLCIGTPKDTE